MHKQINAITPVNSGTALFYSHLSMRISQSLTFLLDSGPL